MLDFGIPGALTRVIASQTSKNESKERFQLVISCLILFFLLASFAQQFWYIFSDFIVSNILNIPSHLSNDFIFAFELLLISYIFHFPLLILKSIFWD